MISANTWAQDTAGQFFDKDFAKNPLGAKSEAREPKISNLKSVDLENTKIVDKTTASKSKKRHNYKHIQTIDNFQEKNGQKILQLGLIVSTKDKEHYTQTIDEFAQIIKTHDLDVNYVYLLGGNLDLASDKVLASLIPYGAIVTNDNLLPEQYAAVTNSPAYLIFTNEGQYILEGVEDLSIFINSAGEFIEEPILAPVIKTQVAAPEAGEF